MNVSLLAVLNDAERLLVAETERPSSPRSTRTRPSSWKPGSGAHATSMLSQYRRAASAAVIDHGGRGRARQAEHVGPHEGRGVHRRARSGGQAPAPWVPGRQSGTADEHRVVVVVVVVGKLLVTSQAGIFSSSESVQLACL